MQLAARILYIRNYCIKNVVLIARSGVSRCNTCFFLLGFSVHRASKCLSANSSAGWAGFSNVIKENYYKLCYCAAVFEQVKTHFFLSPSNVFLEKHFCACVIIETRTKLQKCSVIPSVSILRDLFIMERTCCTLNLPLYQLNSRRS